MVNNFNAKNMSIACYITAIVIAICFSILCFLAGSMNERAEMITDQDAFLRLYDSNGKMTGSYAVNVDEKSDAIYCNLKDGGTVTIEFEK